VLEWVTNVILAVLADVGYALDSVRESDFPNGHYVPLLTLLSE